MDFLTDLFSALDARDSLLVLLFLFIAFLIGLIAGWLYWRGRLESLRTRLTGSQESLARTQAEREEATVALDRSRQDGERLQAELQSARTNLHDCQAEKGQMRADLQALREAMAQPGISSGGVQALVGVIPAADGGDRDDLKRISGVGPAIEKKLNELGIFTYAQISRFDDALVERVNAAIEFFPGRIARDNWVGQAKELLRQKQENPGAFADNDLPPSDPEDLKIIEGIGPVIEQMLKDAGIRNWQELADAGEERLRAVLQLGGEAFRIHDPASWPRQAALAAAGDWKAFRELTDFLIRGRDPQA